MRIRGARALVPFAILWAPAAAAAAAADAVDPSALALRMRENAAVERLAEATKGSDFYLVLEPDSAALTLQLGGAKLRRIAVESMEFVTPSLAFVPRRRLPPAEAAALLERTWKGGELDPPRKRDRIEVAAPPPDPNREEGSVAIPVPPPAEVAILVPDRYFLRFADGLVLEITAERPGLRSSATWEDRLAALGLRKADWWRLRLRLSAADADLLYRALPPSIGFVAWPEGASVRP